MVVYGIRWGLKLKRGSFAYWFGVLGCVVTSDGFGQPPPNDSFAEAIPLSGDAVMLTGTLANASNELDEEQLNCGSGAPGGSVWWCWTATNASTVVIDKPATNVTPDWYAAMDVFAGADLATLVRLDCTYLDVVADRYISFEATAGMGYYIRVGGVGGPFTLRLVATNAPSILSPPRSRTVAEASSTVFTVVAAGLQPLKYQWYAGSAVLTNQTKPVLLLHGLTTNQAGAYAVVVSNAEGVVTSTAANLLILPRTPLPRLTALGQSGTNRFYFSLTGDAAPDYYLIESSTNLVQWAGEPSLFSYEYDGNAAVVAHFGENSVVTVPMESGHKFVRVMPYLADDMCIAQLEGIRAAMNLSAIESRQLSTTPINVSQVKTYMDECFCPSGGKDIGDSYTLHDAITLPYCIWVAPLHRLPP